MQKHYPLLNVDLDTREIYMQNKYMFSASLQDGYVVRSTCVVFPDPVSPTRTKALCSFILSINFSLYSHTGSSILFLRMSKYLSENSLPLNGLIFPRRLLGLLTEVQNELTH